MRTNKRTFPGAKIIPESCLVPLDLTAVFGRAARLEVDLGCGDGSFLTVLAEQNPATNFLGIDQLVGRVRSTARKIGDQRLTNARILQEDILHSVQQLLPPASVDVFHLMFPDPWPKRRHEDRRIVSESFLRAVARALKPGGELRVVTDHAEYFSAMQITSEGIKGLKLCANDSLGAPMSTFEKRFGADGAEVFRMALRKAMVDPRCAQFPQVEKESLPSDHERNAR